MPTDRALLINFIRDYIDFVLQKGGHCSQSLIMMSTSSSRKYPRLDFGMRYGTDVRKVLVWTGEHQHSEMTVEDAVDVFLSTHPEPDVSHLEQS